MGNYHNITTAVYSGVTIKSRNDKNNSQIMILDDLVQNYNLSEDIKIEIIDDERFNLCLEQIEQVLGVRQELFCIKVEKSFTLVFFIDTCNSDTESLKIENVWKEHYSIMENTKVKNVAPSWCFTFTIFDHDFFLDRKTDLIFKKLNLEIDKFNKSSIQTSGFNGWCNWNGGFLLLNKNLESNKLYFVLIIEFIRWEITENTYKHLVHLFKEINNKSNTNFDEEYLNIFQRLTYFILILDKNVTSYSEEDISLHELIEKGWDFDNLLQKTKLIFIDLERIISLSHEIDSKKSASKINKYLNYVTIIGFSGAVAGIISTVDFENSLLNNAFIRFILISTLTISTFFLFKRIERSSKSN